MLPVSVSFEAASQLSELNLNTLVGMTTLYFDESGYTGPNLLDSGTPYYCCASLRITEQRAQELKRLIFPDKSAELKFADLKSGANFHRSFKMVKTLLDEQAVKITVIDKNFALTAKLFECIAEPSLSDHFDLYSKGQLPQLVSAFHLTAKTEQPEKFLAVQKAFYQAVKAPGQTEVQALICALQALEGRPREIAKNVLIPPLEGDYQPLFEGYGITEGPLGILMSAAWQNLLLWGEVIPDGSPINVIYDSQSVMEAEKAMWDQITSAKLDMVSNGTRLGLNHPVTTVIGDSKTYVGLQIADVVAGFAAFAVQTAARAKIMPSANVSPNGLKAMELLLNPKYKNDQHIVAVMASLPEYLSGWSVSSARAAKSK